MAKRCLLFFRCGDQSVSYRLLAGKLAGAPRRLGLFSCRLLRRLLIEAPSLHFAEHAFPLHFLLQNAKSLIDVVIADEYLHTLWLRLLFKCIGRDLDARVPGAHAPRTTQSISVVRVRPMPRGPVPLPTVMKESDTQR
jgi:hypothetical protein